jgi:hypothetical protein
MAASVPICSATSTGCPQREQEQAPGRGLAPFGEKPPDHRRVLVIGRRRRVLIADKQGIERSTACRHRSLDHPARCLARVCHVRMMIARQRDPDSHRVILIRVVLWADRPFDNAKSAPVCEGEPLRCIVRGLTMGAVR